MIKEVVVKQHDNGYSATYIYKDLSNEPKVSSKLFLQLSELLEFLKEYLATNAKLN